jgi:hypothetical protein
MVSNHLNTTQWDVIVGHYHVPSPGQYFLEVIVTMLCIKLKPTTHFTKTRLVDHSQHRLTWDGVFSNVHLVHTQDERNIISHWYDARGNGTYLYWKRSSCSVWRCPLPSRTMLFPHFCSAIQHMRRRRLIVVCVIPFFPLMLHLCFCMASCFFLYAHLLG